MQDEAFERKLNDMTAKASMPDYKFPSSVPIIGWIISACRRLWNSVSTRWYVQHYVQGQSGFNAAVVDTLRYQHYTIADQSEQTNRRLLAQAEQLDAVMAICRELQQSVAHHQEQMQSLSVLQEQILLTRKLFDSDLEAIVRQMHPRKP